MNNEQVKPSRLSALYRRQQPKIHANSKVAGVLKTFAEEDYKRIAQLLKRWLNEDNKKTKR